MLRPKENYTPAACIDAESRPPAPCEATGECQDLQDCWCFADGSKIVESRVHRVSIPGIVVVVLGTISL